MRLVLVLSVDRLANRVLLTGLGCDPLPVEFRPLSQGTERRRRLQSVQFGHIRGNVVPAQLLHTRCGSVVDLSEDCAIVAWTVDEISDW